MKIDSQNMCGLQIKVKSSSANLLIQPKSYGSYFDLMICTSHLKLQEMWDFYKSNKLLFGFFPRTFNVLYLRLSWIEGGK